jgi:hypothetical protein
MRYTLDMPKQLTLTYISPTVIYDGATVNIKSDGAIDLLFHQTTFEDNDKMAANVVAAIKFPSEAAWIEIRQMVDATLQTSKNREA